MKTLSIDIETYSDLNLAKTGVYRYVESPVFEILLFSYSADGAPVQLIDLACGEKIPAEVISALTDDSVTKWAFNANFERICLSRFLGLPTGEYLKPDSWKCSMVWAATMGLPLSLEGAGAVLGLENQKLTEGKDLIKYFCQPCTPTKSNGQRTRNLPYHAPDKWLAFKKYNIRDVETEMSIQARLAKYPVPDSIWDEYHIDQEINDRGVALDMELVRQAIQMDARSRSELTQAMKDMTELENPNSVQQMKQWLSDNGLETNTLGKKAVAELLKTAPPELQKVLTLRQQLAKSSVKKYQAMETAVCADGRARGMFQFYGANRTGRWAGRIIQMQNLPQNHLDDLSEARALVRCSDFDALEMLYEDVPDTLSQLIRTAFVPRKDAKLIVADFSAIEARVIAWLAGEEWRQKVFTEDKDIYCASASQMFGVPVEKHGINGHLRQKGKIAELALGYGGSVGALKAMGALEMGLAEDELPLLVDAWRQSNPKITKLWWDVDRAAMEAVRYKHTNETHGITFSCRSGMLFITLPSGRQLAYVKPRIGENKFGGQCITYEGVGATKKWERLDSYGPKFVENIVQATARDILCYAMKNLRCCAIVMHIHDEVVIEADSQISLQAVCDQMGRTPPWAKGLQLRADGYETDFYKKD
jgi:DNA polymerase